MAGSREDVPPVDSDVDDAGSAREVASRFARTSANAHPQDFVPALAEQEHPIQRAISDAGYAFGQAGIVAREVAAAMAMKRRRIADAGANPLRGRA